MPYYKTRIWTSSTRDFDHATWHVAAADANSRTACCISYTRDYREIVHDVEFVMVVAAAEDCCYRTRTPHWVSTNPRSTTMTRELEAPSCHRRVPFLRAEWFRSRTVLVPRSEVEAFAFWNRLFRTTLLLMGLLACLVFPLLVCNLNFCNKNIFFFISLIWFKYPFLGLIHFQT